MFINLLNKVPVGNINGYVEKLLKKRFIHKSDEKYSKKALHKYVKDKPAMKRNGAVLNGLLGELYTIEDGDKIPDNYKYSLATIQVAQN